MRKPILAFSFLFLLLGATLFGAEADDYEETYVLGNRTFSINLGAGLPLFFQDFGGETYPANLELGMHGALQMDVYLNDYFRTGMSIGGMINGGPNKDDLYMVPMIWENTAELRYYPFKIPVSLGMGLNISQYKDESHTDFILKPGAGFYYYINSEWAFGLDLDYWWVPQLYNENNIGSDQNRMGNFLGITLGALYHF